MEVKLEVADGKYTLGFDEATGKFYCLRYGAPWRDLVGDKMVLSLFYRIKDLEDKKLLAGVVANTLLTEEE